MSRRAADTQTTLCPVARAQALVGDRWSILILRELFMRNHRFESIQAQTGATPQMLAGRLKKLEASGLIERRPYRSQPRRYEYFLTPMGDALHPIMLALRAWGETWLKSGEDLAIAYIHLPCGEDPGFELECQNCGEAIRREDLRPSITAAFAAERDRRWAEFKETH